MMGSMDNIEATGSGSYLTVEEYWEEKVRTIVDKLTTGCKDALDKWVMEKTEERNLAFKRLENLVLKHTEKERNPQNSVIDETKAKLSGAGASIPSKTL